MDERDKEELMQEINTFDEEYEGIFRVMKLQMQRGLMQGEPPWGKRVRGGKSQGEIRRNELFMAHRDRLINIFSREEHDCTSKKRQLLVKLMKSLSSSAASSSSGASSSSYSANMVVVDLSEVATKMISSLASSMVHHAVEIKNNCPPPPKYDPCAECEVCETCSEYSFTQGLVTGLAMGLSGLGLWSWLFSPRPEVMRTVGTMSQVTYQLQANGHEGRFRWRGIAAETIEVGPTSVGQLPRSWWQRISEVLCGRRRVVAR
jgi:hypothetical protein